MEGTCASITMASNQVALMLFGLFVTSRGIDLTPAGRTGGVADSVADAAALRDFSVVADGLSRLLSHWRANGSMPPLEDVVIAYHRITSAVEEGHPVRISAELMADVARTIEPFADAATRAAARRCVARLLGEG